MKWLCIWLLLGIVSASTSTTSFPDSLGSSASTSEVPTAGTTAKGVVPSAFFNTVSRATTSTPKTNTTTEKTAGGTLLRHQLAASPESPRIRGRIVLANTRLEGSDAWGVNADQAEAACERIARYQSQSGSINSFFRSLLLQFISVQRKKPSQKVVGHLLSVGSSHEVLTLTRLLSPLPKGSYWTGGRLVRYTVNNMHRNTHSEHVMLTWTDGRIGNPDILGMTSEDRKQLHEGYTYCLALDLRESTWQARDCSDQLPYACLITPRHFNFSNKVTVHSTAGSDRATPASVETTITTPSSTGPMSSIPLSTVPSGMARAANELGVASTATTSTEEMKSETEEATTTAEQTTSAEESTTTEESTTAEESTTTEEFTTAEESTTTQESTTAEESTTAALLKETVPRTTELPVMTTLSVIEEQTNAIIPEQSSVSINSVPVRNTVPTLSQENTNTKSAPDEVENSFEELTEKPGSINEAVSTYFHENQNELERS